MNAQSKIRGIRCKIKLICDAKRVPIIRGPIYIAPVTKSIGSYKICLFVGQRKAADYKKGEPKLPFWTLSNDEVS